MDLFCKKQIEKILSKRKKKAEERKEHYLEEEKRGDKGSKAMHQGALLKSIFHFLRQGMESIEVEDWEREGALTRIALDPLRTPHENLQLYFKQARKAKKRWEILPDLIQKTEKELTTLEEWILKLEAMTSEEELRAFCSRAKIFDVFPKEEKEVVLRKHYREFQTASGLFVFVGRNDRANDQLTFSVARGNDLWFHAADVSGSHVILRVPREREVDRDSILEALQLALFYSKARNQGEADVVMTQCKYVRRTGRKPGQVALSQYETRRVIIDRKLLKRLKIIIN